MKRAKAISIPGKERPAASQSRIQEPPATKLHHKNAGRNTKPSDSRLASQTCRGSRSPILPEPAPCYRPWITPQCATPAERLQLLGLPQLPGIVRSFLEAAAGMLFVAGLWTPMTGVLVVIVELWCIASRTGEVRNCLLLATFGAALNAGPRSPVHRCASVRKKAD